MHFFSFVIDTEISAFKKNHVTRASEAHQTCANPQAEFLVPSVWNQQLLQKMIHPPTPVQAPRPRREDSEPPEMGTHSQLLRQRQHLVTFHSLPTGSELESGLKKRRRLSHLCRLLAR